jgi:hypothetical protein
MFRAYTDLDGRPRRLPWDRYRALTEYRKTYFLGIISSCKFDYHNKINRFEEGQIERLKV